MSDEDEMGSQVFRQRIVAGGKEHGLVGFDRHGGIDCIRIVSWANGQTAHVTFELSAALPLAALIRHAYETRDRPDEDSCFSFPKADLSAVSAAEEAKAEEVSGRAKHVGGKIKLTPEKVREIRRIVAAGGVNLGELAGEYGISYLNLYCVVTKRTWKGVEG